MSHPTLPAPASFIPGGIRRSASSLLACSLAILLAACSTLPAPDSAGGSGDTGEPGVNLGSLGPPTFPQGPLQPLSNDSFRGPGVAALTPPEDLWSRMRQGFAMPDLENELVTKNTQWYADRPDYITRMTERSNKYLFHIVEELERRNMPTELALLPFIESAFNPQAVSSAQAAGMWQFIPSTGRHFELTQNAFRDDRRDVLASTRAALDYLNRLYGMFGDWQLALAAYNWGEGSVSRAQARNEKQGLGLRYTDLTMPAETRNYVPKLQAVKNIIADPARYGVRLPKIENHPYFQTVDIDRDMDVTVAAQLAGVSVEDFKSLNPSASKPLIMAAGTPQILLPWDNAITFSNNLRRFQGQLASWTVWVSPATMTAAEAAQRVGMGESELRSANNIPARMRIGKGSALLVTRTASMNDVSSQAADSGRIAFAPEPPSNVRHVVKRGESVGGIAARYGVSSAQVVSWNKLRSASAIRIGQSLVIYPSGRGAPAASAAAPSSSAATKAPARAAARSAAKSSAKPAARPAQKGNTAATKKKL